jgi:hypothetical protein
MVYELFLSGFCASAVQTIRFLNRALCNRRGTETAEKAGLRSIELHSFQAVVMGENDLDVGKPLRRK